MTQESSDSFDLNAWKNQGATELKKLEMKENSLMKDLDSVRENIEEMKKALGQETKSKKRPRIRPLILDFLLKNKGKQIEVGVLWGEIARMNSNIEEKAFNKSLGRLASKEDNIELTETHVTFQ